MMIIDSHTHLGDCRIFDMLVTEEYLIQQMSLNNIDASIVLPLPGTKDYKLMHKKIAELADRKPGSIYGVASIPPHIDDAEYLKELDICINEYRFVGLKMHTVGHAVIPTSKKGKFIAEAALRYNIPLIIHTGIGVPFALPSAAIPLAQEYKDLKIVLAHSGAKIYVGEAILAAQLCENIYLETSWSSPIDIKKMVDLIGADRVMFGSDGPDNILAELTKHKSSKISEDDLSKTISGSAIAVFGLSS